MFSRCREETPLVFGALTHGALGVGSKFFGYESPCQVRPDRKHDYVVDLAREIREVRHGKEVDNPLSKVLLDLLMGAENLW